MTSDVSLRDILRVPEGPVLLPSYAPDRTPGFDGGKSDGQEALPAMGEELAELQTRLFAHGYTGGDKRILLVLQGMDTSGKGGVVKHCVGLFDPNGVRIAQFKKPTEEELEHDFLWRVEKVVPEAGQIGIFDRSHYEDVLIARVHQLAEADEIDRRYDAINEFEKRLVDEGTTIVKCLLNISAETQRERLLSRLDDPTKQWKYKPDDVDERMLWTEYQRAVEIALERCNTEHAPWYVVPSDKKWYRNWAVGELLLETLRDLGLTWPSIDYDIPAEKKRLAAT
ncbi:MAG: PPK2 family polyphosphate kinase [Nocardioides sp.]